MTSVCESDLFQVLLRWGGENTLNCLSERFLYREASPDYWEEYSKLGGVEALCVQGRGSRLDCSLRARLCWGQPGWEHLTARGPCPALSALDWLLLCGLWLCWICVTTAVCQDPLPLLTHCGWSFPYFWPSELKHLVCCKLCTLQELFYLYYQMTFQKNCASFTITLAALAIIFRCFLVCFVLFLW